jgi:hypothetical protein
MSKTNFLSDKFIERYIQNDFDSAIAKSNTNKHKAGGNIYVQKASILDDESEMNIPHYCVTCVVGGHILFFKEKWMNWEFIKFINEHEVQDLRNYKKI